MNILERWTGTGWGYGRFRSFARNFSGLLVICHLRTLETVFSVLLAHGDLYVPDT